MREGYRGPDQESTWKWKKQETIIDDLEVPFVSDAQTMDVEPVSSKPLTFLGQCAEAMGEDSYAYTDLKWAMEKIERFIGDASKAEEIVTAFVGDVHKTIAYTEVSCIRLVLEQIEDGSKEVSSWYESVQKDFRAETAAAFLRQYYTVGRQVVREFFSERQQEWETFPEFRGAILEEFFVDYRVATDLAKKNIAKMQKEKEWESMVLEMPEADDEDLEVAVELVIPKIEFDPQWFTTKGLETYKYGGDDDDTDYELPSEFSVYKNLGESPKRGDLIKLHAALRNGTLQQEGALIEKMIGLGVIPEEKRETIMRGLEFVSQVWGLQDSEDKRVVTLRDKRENMKDAYKVPPSAESFDLHHKLLDRRRTIPSFDSTLNKQMMEALLAGVVHNARANETDFEKLAMTLISTEQQARKLYKDVVDRGVPVFRDYIRWVDGEEEKARQKGEEHPGEFYVGRDTYQTLYPAARALRWGEMPGGERNKLTVFVNISRPLLSSMRETETAKEIMRAWLKQEGVTQKMFGIDGGYTGSGPMGTFQAMNPDFNWGDGDKQVKLLETSNSERRLDPAQNYVGFVRWMEALPKFTDRAQKVAQTDLGKYYAVEKPRSPFEQTLAWTVQHAVWRELVQFDPNEPPPLSAGEGVPLADNDQRDRSDYDWVTGETVGNDKEIVSELMIDEDDWGMYPDIVETTHSVRETSVEKNLPEFKLTQGEVTLLIDHDNFWGQYSLQLFDWDDSREFYVPKGVTQEDLVSVTSELKKILDEHGVSKTAELQISELLIAIASQKGEGKEEFLKGGAVETYISTSMGYVELYSQSEHHPARLDFSDKGFEITLPRGIEAEQLNYVWDEVVVILQEESDEKEMKQFILESLMKRFPGGEITEQTYRQVDGTLSAQGTWGWGEGEQNNDFFDDEGEYEDDMDDDSDIDGTDW